MGHGQVMEREPRFMKTLRMSNGTHFEEKNKIYPFNIDDLTRTDLIGILQVWKYFLNQIQNLIHVGASHAG